jgi:hypothetical protein
MTAPSEPLDHLQIQTAVRKAYESAGMPVATGLSNIVPLRRLVAAHPLFVDEVSDLCPRVAAAHMRARAGREIVRPTQAEEELAGFLYANAAGGWILVRQGDFLPRRRFTIAHELGHYLLHFLPILEYNAASQPDHPLDLSESLPPAKEVAKTEETGAGSLVIHGAHGRQPGMIDGEERLEEQADLFAAELLMPSDVCRALVQQFAPRYGARASVLARRLAGELLVSEAAMARRLRELQVA